MHTQSIKAWQHSHVFLGHKHARHARRTWAVVSVSLVMMIAEVIGGTIFGSMAVVADGWHMATHVAALAISGAAYWYAARHANDPRFSFGTGKLGELAGFASAIILAAVALFIAVESALRLAIPVAIAFGEAMIVAVIGLLVNLVCAWLLFDPDHHHHGEAEEEDHRHRHDSNIGSAYAHVLADAFTSVLAIVALFAGWMFGWTWLDAAVGLFGAAVIGVWSLRLMRTAGAVLLDAVPSRRLADAVRKELEVEGDRIADLHLWRLGPGHIGLTVALVADDPQPPGFYKRRLEKFRQLSHVTVEVHACPEHAPGHLEQGRS